MFCSSCGQKISDTDKVCPFCSAVNPYFKNENEFHPVFESPDNGGQTFERVKDVEVIEPTSAHRKTFNREVFETVLRKMNVSCTLWLILSIVMIICGVLSLCVGYGICPILLGIWNIVQISKERKSIEYFRSNPNGMVEYFDAQQTSLIIAFFVNLLFGAVIGVAGIVYDMFTRSYVMEHKDELL